MTIIVIQTRATHTVKHILHMYIQYNAL